VRLDISENQKIHHEATKNTKKSVFLASAEVYFSTLRKSRDLVVACRRKATGSVSLIKLRFSSCPSWLRGGSLDLALSGAVHG
jgi:hypothetical protein